MLQTLRTVLVQTDSLLVNNKFNVAFFEYLGYPLLAQNWPTIFCWFVVFMAISSASLIVQPYLTKQKKDDITRRARINWQTHVTSQIHAVVITTLCIRAMFTTKITDRAAGSDPQILTLANYSLGFFLYDLYICSIDLKYQGLSFTAHALIAINSLLFIYVPRIMYYVPVILMFEFSTIFLNNIWFSDKLGYSGSQFQVANGIGLILAFATVRVGYGTLKFYELANTIFANWEVVGSYLAYTILPSIMILWSLNLFWLYKITFAFANKFLDLKQAKKTGKTD